MASFLRTNSIFPTLILILSVGKMSTKKVLYLLDCMIHVECENKENVTLDLENVRILASTQPAITCSKLITETLEQGVKYVQS